MNQQDNDRILDDALAAIKADQPDARRAEEAAKRAWATVRSEASASERAWDKASHRERRNEFGVAPTAADRPRTPSRVTRLLTSRPARFALATAAAVALALGAATVVPHLSIGGEVGQVDAMEGGLVRLDGGATHALAAGEAVESGSGVRTASGGHAVLQLSDGTRIEMDERSELRLDRTIAGPAIQVVRGRVLVTGGDGRVKILTPDAQIAAAESPSGGEARTYVVNRGVLGTRVTVLEGDVRVDGQSGDVPLAAGEQFMSTAQLEGAPVADELAWSQDAALYSELVAKFREANAGVAQALRDAPVRSSSDLVARVPAGTVIYASFPNVIDEIVSGQAALFERLKGDPRFVEQFTVDGATPPGADQVDDNGPFDVAGMLRDLHEVTSQLGDEIVVAWVMPPQAEAVADAPVTYGEHAAGEPVPVILATSTGDAAITSAVARLAPDDLTVTAQDGLFIASPSEELAVQVRSAAGAGLDSGFRQAVEEAYSRGVTWLGAVDLGSIGARQAADASDDERGVMENSGLLDARYLVVEHRGEETRAHLSFDGPRHGMAAWLAEPSPVGALDFVSGDATLAGAFASKDGVAMFDDVMSMLFGLGDEDPTSDLAEFQAETGVDLRADVAAAIGGEVAFALDGAVLPEPSWKLVVEVLDPARLQHAIEALVSNAAQHGDDASILATEGRDGNMLYTMRVDGDDVAVYTYSDGYLIAAPRRELVDRALRYKADGFTLERSSTFRSLLPTDARPHFSALWYQNLGPVLEPLTQAGQIAGGTMPNEALAVLSETLVPSVSVAYAEENGISVASKGGIGPFGLDVVGMLASTQALGMAEAAGAADAQPVPGGPGDQ